MYVPTLTDRVTGSAVLGRRQALGRTIGATLGRIEVSGRHQVPARGPVVLAINHRSALDGPLVFGAVNRPVSCLVKIEAFTPALAALLRSAGQIAVTRHTVDAAAVRMCLQVLHAGGVLGIFPEGARGDGLVRTAKPGVGYFALRTGAVVVPVACHGTELMTHRQTLRRPVASLTFGTPISVGLAPADRPLNRRLVAATTERIRVALADLVAGTAAPAHQRSMPPERPAA